MSPLRPPSPTMAVETPSPSRTWSPMLSPPIRLMHPVYTLPGTAPEAWWPMSCSAPTQMSSKPALHSREFHSDVLQVTLRRGAQHAQLGRLQRHQRSGAHWWGMRIQDIRGRGQRCNCGTEQRMIPCTFITLRKRSNSGRMSWVLARPLRARRIITWDIVDGCGRSMVLRSRRLRSRASRIICRLWQTRVFSPFRWLRWHWKSVLTGLAVHDVVVAFFGLNSASTTTTSATPNTPTTVVSSATATSTTGVAKVRERDLYPPINSQDRCWHQVM